MLSNKVYKHILILLSLTLTSNNIVKSTEIIQESDTPNLLYDNSYDYNNYNYNYLGDNNLLNYQSNIDQNQLEDKLDKTENPDEDVEIIEEIEEVDEQGQPIFENKIIKDIKISGNNTVPRNLIIPKIDYQIGQKFDPVKTGPTIKNIDKLGYFSDIKLYAENLSPDSMNLIIEVKEKPKVDEIELTGNKSLGKKDIEEKIKLSEIHALDEHDTNLLIKRIQKLYIEKNYHAVEITPELKQENNIQKLILKVKEGAQASVRRLFFKGNKAFSNRALKKVIYTKEDWLFGFVEKAGMFIPEMVEGDKHAIETFYQSNGYLAAKVKDVKIDINPKSQTIEITYDIEEGDKYTVTQVNVPGNDILSEDQLKLYLPFLHPGMLYSKELIVKAIDNLKNVWGRLGYIYADINPDVIPNFEDKTVEITFNTELGKKINLRRIDIVGHKKTRDYVIRRHIELDEGQAITSNLMDLSKKQIESLGFFDPKEGVEWRTIRVDDETADLELILNEMKTGKLNAQIGFGGQGTDVLQSPSKGVNAGLSIADRNLLGMGINWNLNVNYSAADRTIAFGIAQPWLFNRPITGGADFYRNKRNYDSLTLLMAPPNQTVTGGNVNMGFIRQTGYFKNTRFWGEIGLEKICNNLLATVRPDLFTLSQREILQEVLRSDFKDGNLTWLMVNAGQDFRNHPIFPNRGYSWTLASKLSLPSFGSGFGYFRTDLVSSFYTPLIGDYDLVFALNGHAGFLHNFNNRSIPYRELFHIGGPPTVRGFKYGQIGPSIMGDSVGAKKAFWLNAELVFKVTQDMSTRAILFYDGGAGWDAPYAQRLLDAGLPLKNNCFNFRHAVGFGIRLMNPAPIRIDWAFKLDRNKRLGEHIHEVHFSMTQDF